MMGPLPLNLSSRPKRSGGICSFTFGRKANVPWASRLRVPFLHEAKLQVRFGRDDKFKGAGPPWLRWMWMDRVKQPAFHAMVHLGLGGVDPVRAPPLARTGSAFDDGSSDETFQLLPSSGRRLRNLVAGVCGCALSQHHHPFEICRHVSVPSTRRRTGGSVHEFKPGRGRHGYRYGRPGEWHYHPLWPLGRFRQPGQGYVRCCGR
jgi:hypothetical protein